MKKFLLLIEIFFQHHNLQLSVLQHFKTVFRLGRKKSTTFFLFVCLLDMTVSLSTVFHRLSSGFTHFKTSSPLQPHTFSDGCYRTCSSEACISMSQQWVSAEGSKRNPVSYSYLGRAGNNLTSREVAMRELVSVSLYPGLIKSN